MGEELVDIYRKNKDLKEELWARGYYVQEIGEVQAGEIAYLVVTCAPPKNANKEWLDSVRTHP